MSALRARLARLVALLRQHGLRRGIARIIAARRSPLFGLSAPQVALAHVTRMDRSSSRLVVHGRSPSGAKKLECTAVVQRHLATFPVDVQRTDGRFELEVPLQPVARLDGVCEIKLVLSDGSKRWLLGRDPQPDLYNEGAVTVPLTVVALPGGAFVRLRVRAHPDGELRVVTERMPGKVPA